MNLRKLTSAFLVFMSIGMLQGCGSCTNKVNYDDTLPPLGETLEIGSDYTPEVFEELSEPTYSLQDEIYAHFREYLKAGIREDENGRIVFTPSDIENAIPYYEPEFSVLDINGDGYNDLVVWGYLGLRCKILSTVYEYYEGDYYEYNLMGQPVRYANGYLFVTDPDYADAGAVMYLDEYVYAPNAQYEPDLVLDHHREEVCYNSETDEEYNPTIVTDSYNDGMNELNKDDYEAKLIEYIQDSFEITYFALNENNIENFCR